MCAGKRQMLRATVVTIFSHMTRDVSVFVKCNMIYYIFFVNYHTFELLTFAKLVLQHTEGTVGSIILVLLEMYLSLQQ